MNRARALIICTHPSDYLPTRVREAAKHLLAQDNLSEEEKRLAEEALKSLQPPAEPTPQMPPRRAAQAGTKGRIMNEIVEGESNPKPYRIERPKNGLWEVVA